MCFQKYMNDKTKMRDNVWHSNSPSYQLYDELEGSYGKFKKNQPMRFSEFLGQVHGGVNQLKDYHFSFVQGGQFAIK